MEDILMDFQYLFIGITVLLFIALVGYIKENKKIKSTQTKINVKEDIEVSTVSINDLENSIDNLNV